MVLPPSLKRVVPGSVPPWRAPCFAWPCRGFGCCEFFSWLCHGFLFPAARNRGAASEVVRRRADFLQFSILRGFAQSRRHSLQRGARFLEASVLLSQRARKASLMSAQLFAFAFPLARNFATGRLPLVPHTRAHGCCCSQPFASRCARLFLPRGFRRAPPKFGCLSCAGNLLRLALGYGIWVGGIEIEALDDLRFEKIHVSKSLNPKP